MGSVQKGNHHALFFGMSTESCNFPFQNCQNLPKQDMNWSDKYKYMQQLDRNDRKEKKVWFLFDIYFLS